MAGTVRISALTPLTSVTPDDFIIINNANSNTQTVSFDNFVKSVNAVMSVNGQGGPAITLTAGNVGAYTTAEVDTLLNGKTDQATTTVLSARVDDLETAVGENTAKFDDYALTTDLDAYAALAAADQTFTGNLEVDGTLTAGGSQVATLANLVNVAVKTDAESIFTGNVEVNGILTAGGSQVATSADLVTVANKEAAESIFTGNVEVNGALTQAGSAVVTTATNAATVATVASNTELAQQGVDDAAAALTAAQSAGSDATAAQTTANDLGAQIGSTADAVTETTINGKLNATGQALNEVKTAAATALAAFQAGGATDADKLNACQTFFDTLQALTVTA